MSKVIAFPSPHVETYNINYSPLTGMVDIPLIPDDRFEAAKILAVFIAMLIDEGTLSVNDVCQVTLQATGNL